MEANPAPPAPANGSPERFLQRLARALHVYGTPVHQVEDTLDRAAARLGVTAQFSATPTSILMSFGAEHERTRLLRLEPGAQDLGRLTQVTQVARGVAAGTLSPADGTVRLDAIATAPVPYPAYLTVLAFALTSTCAARFLGGGPREVAVATVVGFLTADFYAEYVNRAVEEGLTRLRSPSRRD